MTARIPLQVSAYARSLLQLVDADALAAELIDTGTFTPTFDFATTGDLSVGYTGQSGRYIDFLGMVYVRVSLNFTPTFTTSSGDALIGTLPSNPQAQSAMSIINIDADWTWPGSRTMVQASAQTDGTVKVAAFASATGRTFLGASDMTSGNLHNIAFNGVYEKA